MAKHTPGPWGYCPPKPDSSEEHQVNNSEGYCVAILVDRPEANARLVEAAPDMLAALQSVFCQCSSLHPCDPDCFMPKVEAAIAKAEGGV